MGNTVLALTSRDVKAMDKVFTRANNLRRWTSFRTSGEYDELAKLGLNNVTVFILASYAENAGVNVDWTNLPKLAIHRAFKKVYVVYDTPEYIFKKLCESGEVSMDDFNTATREIIAEKTDKNFAEFICEARGSYEERIYKAATKIATLVELKANERYVNKDDYCKKYAEIMNSLENYQDIPGLSEMMDMNGKIFGILTKIASLRNQNRWAAMSYLIECSVLGHLFDTGVFAYFMALESDPNDEETAAKRFFMGVWHDVPEAWTTDIPSPIKNRIPNLRKMTEKFEMEMLEENLFNQVPEFLAKKIKEVMMEGEENANVKPLMKGADYLSGDSECHRQYVAGSNEAYFRGAMRRNQELIEEGKIRMTPVCFLFDRYLLQHVEQISQDIPDEEDE